MRKLDVVIMKWENEVEEKEIELIERGVPPHEATKQAVSMVISKRRQEYADKGGG